MKKTRGRILCIHIKKEKLHSWSKIFEILYENKVELKTKVIRHYSL
jgi:hypothetical protein